VLGGQLVGLVELDPAAAVLAENAVEDDEVVVRVDIERGAEAMKGSSPCGSPRTLGFAPPP
jgi:hypothetical protein